MSKGGGGSDKQQSVVVQNQPLQYGPYSENMLKRLYGYSQNLLDQPLTPTQVTSIKQQRNLASQGGQLLKPATGSVKNIMAGGGMSAASRGVAGHLAEGDYVNPAMAGITALSRGGQTNPAMAGISRAAQGFTNPARAGAQAISQRGISNPAMAGFQGMARGAGPVNPAMAGFQRYAGGQGLINPAMSGFQSMAGGQGPTNAAMSETRRMAMGGDVGNNPFLEATYERASRPLLQQLQQDVNPAIDIGAASAGRGGSGMHALLRNRAGEQTGQALTDLATGIYGGAYESDQARRMQALGQYGGMSQEQIANKMAALGQVGQLGQQQLANRFAAMGQVGQLGQEQIGNRMAALGQVGQLGQANADLRMQALGMTGQLSQADQANRLQAMGMQGNLGQQAVANQMQALGMRADLGQQAINNRIAGAGLYDTGMARQLQAAGMAPGLEAARYADPMMLWQSEEMRRNQPYNIANQYAGVLGAFPKQGGGSTQNTYGASQQGGGLMGGIAGGLSGAGTGMYIGGPWGAAIGGGLGALGGMFSDVRTKRDIRPVGMTFGGAPLYSYRYREEFGGGPAQIGVLAQEIAEDQPDAVYRGPDDLLRVLYQNVK